MIAAFVNWSAFAIPEKTLGDDPAIIGRLYTKAKSSHRAGLKL